MNEFLYADDNLFVFMTSTKNGMKINPCTYVRITYMQNTPR